MTAKLVTAQEEIAVLTKEKGELSQEVSAKQTEITGLQTKIQTLSRPCGAGRGEGLPSMARLEPDAKDIVMNWDDEKTTGRASRGRCSQWTALITSACAQRCFTARG